MKPTSASCDWIDKSKNLLCNVRFDVFPFKIDDIVNEFGGDRKQSRVDTLLDGLTKAARPNIASKLVGQKFIVSLKGQPLYLTHLSPTMLTGIPLPQEYEDLINPPNNPVAPVPAPTTTAADTSTVWANIAFDKTSSSPIPKDTGELRLGLAGKILFKSIAAFLKPVHNDEHDDLFILEVQQDMCPMEVIDSIFHSGEKIDPNKDKVCISFGLQKAIA